MNTIKKTATIAEDAKIIKLSVLWAVRFKVLSYCCLLSCMLLAQSLMAAEESGGNLVTAEWLEKNLNNEDVLILDASPAKIYSEQHIPGAKSVNLFTYGAREIPNADMEQLFQSWGISSGKKIVLYDQGGTMMATRLFFSLYYYGFPVENLSILDGGLFKWQEKGLPVTKDSPPDPKKGTFTITKLNEEVRDKLPEFITASGDLINNVLLEALTADWHFGQTQFFGRPGHIPNAIMIPSADFYNPDKTFKSADDIRKMLSYFRISPEQQIHTHCGGGVAASVPFFALKFILNYPKIKLFTESQLGWVSDERELPFWTYDAPFLMRESNWLQSWGGKMLRMYGIAQVSIVDLRPADIFNQGHVPYALNINAEVFKSNITDPGNLAKILGLAGVNASHEAVVISGAGLTKESALAFVMLEKLGQKVSVFMDSMDKWVQLGFTIIKDTSDVEPQNDLSIPPTNYPGNFRKDLIIDDPKSTHGLYPKVFIASGMNVPDKIQDGKVVHVPYTALLNGDGTPKAAKDIWNILTNAEVPRYAELVCFSDDPGEAAINYFILKLMGYPDIKVLVI